MSLTKFHTENFNDQHLHMWVPEFTSNERGFDRPFLLWMYCVGLNHGFQNKYSFYIADYLLCVPYYTISKIEIPRFNEKYGKWVKMGYRDRNISWFQFKDSDWTFVEHMETDPRLQRIWIHLWNSVYTTKGLTTVPRNDLFYTGDPVYAGMGCLHDWQPFSPNAQRSRATAIQKSKGQLRGRQYPSTYLHKGGFDENRLPLYPKYKLKDE